MIGKPWRAMAGLILETAVGVECGEISIGYAADVGANSFALQFGSLRF
jgi:hypothetical protein